MNLRHEVQDIATELESWASENGLDLTVFESLQIAVQIQKNKLYGDSMFKDDDYIFSNLDSIEESLLLLIHLFNSKKCTNKHSMPST